MAAARSWERNSCFPCWWPEPSRASCGLHWQELEPGARGGTWAQFFWCGMRVSSTTKLNALFYKLIVSRHCRHRCDSEELPFAKRNLWVSTVPEETANEISRNSYPLKAQASVCITNLAFLVWRFCWASHHHYTLLVFTSDWECFSLKFSEAFWELLRRLTNFSSFLSRVCEAHLLVNLFFSC